MTRDLNAVDQGRGVEFTRILMTDAASADQEPALGPAALLSCVRVWVEESDPDDR
jgi:hypothetical protein